MPATRPSSAAGCRSPRTLTAWPGFLPASGTWMRTASTTASPPPVPRTKPTTLMMTATPTNAAPTSSSHSCSATTPTQTTVAAATPVTAARTTKADPDASARQGDPQQDDAYEQDSDSGVMPVNVSANPRDRCPFRHRTGPGAAGPTPDVNVVYIVITLDTLLGLADTPADVSGMGPIPADLARELAADGRWRLSSRHRDRWDGDRHLPTHLHPWRRPRPTHPSRETYCRMPGCNRQTAGCDLDHTIPYPAEPGTTDQNLGPLCRGHHNLKTHHGYQLTNLPPPGTTRRPGRTGAGSESGDETEPPGATPDRTGARTQESESEGEACPAPEPAPAAGNGPSLRPHPPDQPEPPLPDREPDRPRPTNDEPTQ